MPLTCTQCANMDPNYQCQHHFNWPIQQLCPPLCNTSLRPSENLFERMAHRNPTVDGRTPESNDCERKYEQLVATVPVQGTGREFLCFLHGVLLFLSEGSASSNVVLMHTFR
uniref:Uncharacterized protein n=2 Tax=Caenorhabditis japonica TaxID=281687 RepID=A0A8R1E865_CAEJA